MALKILAAVGAVVLLAGALFFLYDRVDVHTITIRGRPDSIEIVAPASDTVLVTSPLIVTWRGVPGADWYKLEFTNASGDLERRLTGSETTRVVPANYLRLGDYTWWVRAHMASGAEDSRSPARRLNVRAP